MELQTLIESIGLLGIAGMVFAESGLFIGAILPGDSLLFTAGFLASQGILDIRMLIPLCFIAAVAGDSFGYAFGRKVGPHIFKREDSFLFHREHLIRAQRFYEKHGGKTIIIARFMPFVRTFAPILAGVGTMHYPRFIAFNVIGGFLWSVGLSMLGYVLGNTIPGVDRYLLPIILGIILASVAPSAWHVLKDPAYRSSLINAFKKFITQTREKKKTRHTVITPPPDYRNTDVAALNNVVRLQDYPSSSKQEFTARFHGAPWFGANVPLRQKTTYRLGGPADYFLTPKTLEDTQEIIKACRELSIPLFILGGGSNVLFSDEGWRGVVLQPSNTSIATNSPKRGSHVQESVSEASRAGAPPGRGERSREPSGQFLAGELNRVFPDKRSEQPVRVSSTSNKEETRWEMANHNRPIPPKKPEAPLGLPTAEVSVGAGASLQQLIIKTHQERLVGLESFSGIPARVGGALRNNAHGGPDNFDRYVKGATLVHTSTGETVFWPREKFTFSYDHSALQGTRDWIVWEVIFSLPQAPDSLWNEFDVFFKSWQAYKAATQTAAGTAGCVYKNINPAAAKEHAVSISAGALIDKMFGLGTTLRTAQISAWHGNFFQSSHGDDSRANDMVSLINFVRDQVKKEKGIELELEIELVGF